MMDYEYLEDPKYHALSQKAWTAVENNHTKTCNFPSILADFLENIILFVVFGGVLSTLHPIIIGLIIASTFVSYIPQKSYQKYEYQTRDVRAKAQRKLWYFASLSDNFSIAKDVRLFGMKYWLGEAAGISANELKRLNLDLGQKWFYVALVGFVVTLLRHMHT